MDFSHFYVIKDKVHKNLTVKLFNTCSPTKCNQWHKLMGQTKISTHRYFPILREENRKLKFFS